MKKQLKLLSLLVVIIFATISLGNKMVFLAANATYVEGIITQDTVWTLIDSPFVVSKNITVQNAKLTIEPGVEVRFGGYFSLTVEGSGSLYAVGTQNNNITFTSNKGQPKAGDWRTIRFIGTEQSTLTYCVLKYATNGTTIENSNVEIRNSEIHDNLNSGIYLTGSNQATIQNNTIRANANGILLTGDPTSGANITYNKVLSNTQSGINLDADSYSNIVILYNILSSNNMGFYVSGQASTYIVNNSISYNTFGIFYQKPADYTAYWIHIARWNDVYGNQLGMEASSNVNVTVSAEYNYWGDESGPYHISLNPAGKGNTVGGDGYNLDFIFFLTAPIGYINQRPVASLLTDKTLVPPNQVVWFVATNSSDDRQVDQYFYDFGDGTNSSWTTLSIFVHKYSLAGTYTATVTVKDDFDVQSINVASAEITVQALTPIEVSLTLDHSTVVSEGQVQINVLASVGTSPIASATITLVSIMKGNLTMLNGSTNSTGYFTTTLAAPKTTEQIDLRIIATVTKSSYADGSDYEYLHVLPLLSVQVSANPSSIKSEATSQVSVQVAHNANPISGVTVKISSDLGSFSKETGSTDLGGSVVFDFTAPSVMTQTSVTITITTTKSGYFESVGQTSITINPKVLNVQVTTSQGAIESEATLNMTVHVTEDANPVAGADITLSSNQGGSFSNATGTTDAKGDFKFVFYAPEATTQVNVTISATATKSGYVSGENQTNVIVNALPSAVSSGLPWTTILLIIIPIVIVAIVAVLIKMQIIVISREEL